MDREHASRGSFVVALICFVLIAATCLVLLITTLVVWLSALTGSMIAATLIVSGLCFVLAVTIYLLALREPLARIQDQIETIYEVAHAAREGYEWVTDKVLMFLKVREALREK